jgi:hypothetical protein
MTKMNTNKVSIPKPCSYGWDKMTVTNDRIGRHCEACNKIVVDFSTMTTTELQSFLASYSAVRLCGHFKTIDTGVSVTWYQGPVLKLHNYIDTHYRKTIFNGLILFSLTFLLGLTGCSTTTDGEVACTTPESSVKDSIAVVEEVKEEMTDEERIKNKQIESKTHEKSNSH